MRSQSSVGGWSDPGSMRCLFREDGDDFFFVVAFLRFGVFAAAAAAPVAFFLFLAAVDNFLAETVSVSVRARAGADFFPIVAVFGVDVISLLTLVDFLVVLLSSPPCFDVDDLPSIFIFLFALLLLAPFSSFPLSSLPSPFVVKDAPSGVASNGVDASPLAELTLLLELVLLPDLVVGMIEQEAADVTGDENHGGDDDENLRLCKTKAGAARWVAVAAENKFSMQRRVGVNLAEFSRNRAFPLRLITNDMSESKQNARYRIAC
mmetsp:Transcript_27028/g.40610  ORF Transcript_27028/g.40610 Transcript_27028/m.40610 type:complete len:263 (-) Transcript_27028:8-796(-)